MIPSRSLGPLDVGCLGLGCMGMTGVYGPTDDTESTRTIHAALDAGVTLFDTADRYGLGKNEELVGRALSGRDARIATKFGIRQGSQPGQRVLDGSPEYVRSACEASLARLGRSTIDVYLLHRVDQNVPIEDTVGAMGRLVEEGKVRWLGLCEVSATTLRRAHEAWPIGVVQSEYSLWCREPELSILPTCRELAVGFLAYWALGMGMLTAKFQRAEDFGDRDLRRTAPRFEGKNFAENLELVRGLEELAVQNHSTPAQLALAWLLAREPFVVPLVGTKRQNHLAENLGAAFVRLERSTLDALEKLFRHGAGAGSRYDADGMRWLNG